MSNNTIWFNYFSSGENGRDAIVPQHHPVPVERLMMEEVPSAIDATGLKRRSVLGMPMAALLLAGTRAMAASAASNSFAFVSRITPKPGMEAEYARVVEQDIGLVDGCLFFSVARDTSNPRCFWTIEFWESQSSYDQAMKLPIFKDIIARAVPLVETYERIATLSPSTITAVR